MLCLISLRVDLTQPVHRWLASVEIDNARLARLLCKLIPDRCPFQRDIKISGSTPVCVSLVLLFLDHSTTRQSGNCVTSCRDSESD
jgi:hypothetical protein